MICLKHFSQNQNYVAMIAQMASIISLHTSQTQQSPGGITWEEVVLA